MPQSRHQDREQRSDQTSLPSPPDPWSIWAKTLRADVYDPCRGSGQNRAGKQPGWPKKRRKCSTRGTGVKGNPLTFGRGMHRSKNLPARCPSPSPEPVAESGIRIGRPRRRCLFEVLGVKWFQVIRHEHPILTDQFAVEPDLSPAVGLVLDADDVPVYRAAIAVIRVVVRLTGRKMK